MKLETEAYLEQQARWPRQGRHILAQYNDTSVVVYQAYNRSIGHFAARNGYFGGSFSLSRMSWVKPNFLWMMYRCGWASKHNQEVVLAVRLKRAAFDKILTQAVHSNYVEEVYSSHAAWKQVSEDGDTRLQWDPDHDPKGQKVERRAIQLGMRGPTLARYAREWLLDIEDISDFVREQYEHVLSGDYDRLLTPREMVYPVADPQVAARLGLAL
ncbi:DUF4291 domain-containing protein [Ktedonospora formicarum]|uniref:DUF4291 domain-containing protein n=1 Tax=Ktedonospora formicarum TaxID=2778364 RepID=A0A8J3I6T5_9CHLR|nr:DUF4291 domain-containing protein [Ktedonospora formicarum]GHO47910.1 hypothetical protein KSX_60730 [Ktedonospora formicarum]